MTEEEAKNRWCPFARLQASIDSVSGPTRGPVAIGFGNRFPDDRVAPCIASGCMAWRKSRVLIDRATLEPAVPGVAAQGHLEERFSGEGYCGLAGAPS